MKPILMVTALLMLVVAGCTQEEAEIPRTTAPALTELRNGTYQGIEEQDPVTLKDGHWEGEPHAEGGSSRPSVYFVRDYHLMADLDGDGLEEAVVLLGANSGGTGENIYLAVVGVRDGQLRNLDTLLLGDRVQLRKAGFLEGRLFVNLLRAGPEDAMCCPGELAMLAWTLKNDKLEPMEAIGVPVRLSLEAIVGPEWVLRWWDREEKAPEEPPVTLSCSEGRLAGKSGCNNWFTAPVMGEKPGDLTIGPTGGTMMMCPDDVMDIERRFLGQLEGVKKYGFMAGMLALSYELDGKQGVMLFEERDFDEPE